MKKQNEILKLSEQFLESFTRLDEKIKAKIMKALLRRSQVDPTEIDVSVASGFVFLQGRVESSTEKKTAQTIIESVLGVKKVKNNLKVRKDSENIYASNPKKFNS